MTDHKLKGFLRNTEQKLSNNTAELSAIGEALLYLLGLFSAEHQRTPKYKLLAIRYDSAYAADVVRGHTSAKENKDMVFEIDNWTD